MYIQNFTYCNTIQHLHGTQQGEEEYSDFCWDVKKAMQNDDVSSFNLRSVSDSDQRPE